MDDAFWRHVKGERFEEFCHEALGRWVLSGEARDNYRSSPKQAPYDGSTHGSFLGHNGGIFFEFKGYAPERDPVACRREIAADLCGSGRSPGKLARTSVECADGEQPLFVLIMSVESTDQFESSIRRFIDEQALPFRFECLDRKDVKQWVTEHEALRERFQPPKKVGR